LAELEAFVPTTHRIPIVLCVDVEPDPRVLTRTGAPPWQGFEATVGFLSSLRPFWQKLTSAPVHFSWFLRLDPQVAECYGGADYPVRHYPTLIAEIARAGDEIGLHVHPHRWDEAGDAFCVDHGNVAWVEHCIRFGLTAYRNAFRKPCRSFRFGDGFSSQESMRLLDDSGVRYELTAEPGAPARPCLVPGEAPYTGELPGWIGIPTRPSRPSRADYRVPDDGGATRMWVIPMSSGNGVDDSMVPTAELPVRTLNLTIAPDLFAAIAARILASSPRPYLGLMMRTDSALDDATRTRVAGNLDVLASHAWAPRFQFSRPGELMAVLGVGDRWLASPGEWLRRLWRAPRSTA
jgi:hypothetical protein